MPRSNAGGVMPKRGSRSNSVTQATEFLTANEPFCDENALVSVTMTPLEDQELDLFERVLEISPDERGQFLDSECKGDAALRERIARLLSYCESEGEDTFLDPPEVPFALFQEQPELELDPNIRTGDYEIERLLGRGSMGNVYEARQLSLNRRVALKMIRGAVLSSESDVVRFRQKRKRPQR